MESSLALARLVVTAAQSIVVAAAATTTSSVIDSVRSVDGITRATECGRSLVIVIVRGTAYRFGLRSVVSELSVVVAVARSFQVLVIEVLATSGIEST